MDPKHEQALAALYNKHGVGDTIDNKYNFWDARYSGGWTITHSPTKEQCVAMFEMSYLVEEFPQDFKYC